MKPDAHLRKLLKAKKVLRAGELSALGVPRKELRGLVERGELVRLGRGLYAAPEIEKETRHSWIQACALVPKGVLCLLSALRFHELTSQLPPDIWMALPRGTWRPRELPVETRFIEVSEKYWKLEVETHSISGVPVRVYGAAKTVVDCFKFRNKVGMDVALEALRDFLKKNRGGSNELWRIAEKARVRKILHPYLEASL